MVIFKSDLVENQDRRLSFTANNVLSPKLETHLEFIKSGSTDHFEIHWISLPAGGRVQYSKVSSEEQGILDLL
jgi:hypothetical protein